jgi:hypothetical protein
MLGKNAVEPSDQEILNCQLNFDSERLDALELRRGEAYG